MPREGFVAEIKQLSRKELEQETAPPEPKAPESMEDGIYCGSVTVHVLTPKPDRDGCVGETTTRLVFAAHPEIKPSFLIEMARNTCEDALVAMQPTPREKA